METENKRFQRIIGNSLIGVCCTVSIVAVCSTCLVRSSTVEQFIVLQASRHDQQLMMLENQETRAIARSYLNTEKPLSPALFSSREIRHMADVKRLYDLLPLTALCLVVISMVCVAFFLESVAQSIALLASASRAALIAVMGVSILAYSRFETVFTFFHQLMFRNDLWLLDPAVDRIIRAYPPLFFEIFALVLLAVLACVFAGSWFIFLYLRHARILDGHGR